MRCTAELIQAVAEGMLGRRLEDDVAATLAQRLTPFLARVRALDESRLIGLEPAATFAAAQPLWESERPGTPAWSGLGPASAGSSGVSINPRAAADALAAGGAPAAPPSPPAPAVAELLYMSAAMAAARIRRHEVSPVELTRLVLDRIASAGPALNCFITVTADLALAEAQAAERALHRGGNLGPLHGVPLAVKDLIATRGIRTTGGSKVLADWVPEADATAVARLRAAGAVVVGKTHTHEFAYGGTSNNPFYGPARNPWGLDRIPGGSSGGSAAAVVAGLCHLALGSDTAGSIRIPAAACGAVGLKPTYGRVSKVGALPLSWSMDTVGPITRTVADAALMLASLAGPDPADHTTVPVPVPDYLGAVNAAARGLQGLRVGVIRRWCEERVEDEVRQACLDAVQVLRDLGADVREVELPAPDQVLLVQRLISMAEASSYHAPYLAEQPENYSLDVRLRLETGLFVLARDYLAGQRLRGEICQRFTAAMTDIDVLVAPALPLRAPRIGQETWDWRGTPDTVTESLIRLTAPFNVTGQPVITVPCGFPGGLPVGLQIAGRPFAEETVLRVAAAYEGATAWHRQRPPFWRSPF